MTTENYKYACIFGGTGFIGRQITRELARLGYIIKVATRVPERAFFLKTCGNVGQVVPFACTYGDEESIRQAVRGCDLVVNCVGILYEKGRNTFPAIHTELPRMIAKACRVEKVERFVHLSALGCEDASSKYGKSKYAGEQAVFENFSKATILRPSVVFGAEDEFFNMFARLSVILPFLPLIGGGYTKFQPVFVGDVADAVVAANRILGTQGKVYELGGPDILSFGQIFDKLFHYTGRKKILLPLPWAIASLQGKLMGLMPKPLLTGDQVESLKSDNVVTGQYPTFKDLDIDPVALDAILPTYLSRYRPGGRFGDKKRA